MNAGCRWDFGWLLIFDLFQVPEDVEVSSNEDEDEMNAEREQEAMVEAMVSRRRERGGERGGVWFRRVGFGRTVDNEEDYLEGIGLRITSVKKQSKTEYDGTGGVMRFEFQIQRKGI